MNEASAARRCPRCGGAFHCGAADPGPCACSGLTLGAALLQRLRGAYAGCLCLACLRELSCEPVAAAAPPTGAGPPTPPRA